ncbi:MAG: endolytic transglycosylase MltG [Candidatus Komeilibacteria bacterium]|nr:endolytic transglycosylase MltG [Candidatus Komeilibacteria bacterium]
MHGFIKFTVLTFIIVLLGLGAAYFIYEKNRPANPALFQYYNATCQALVQNNETCLRLIEGWNNKEIAKYLAENSSIKAEDFLNLTGKDLSQFTSTYDFLADKPVTADLEGYLFPDTYRVFKSATTLEIVKKMLDNFNNKLTPALRAEIKNRQQSIFETITLASIIEKEVRNPEDMKMVADIFYKRLSAGIALQSDATINYITGKGLVQPIAKDLAIDSPYNTYKYKGLTPTPIANPGINAITAAVYPKSNPYYYFLTAPDGQVIYSKTYAEHIANKKKYLD